MKQRFLPRQVLFHARMRPPLILFFTIVALFSIQRLLIWVMMPERFLANPPETFGNAALIGLRFDIVIAGMAAAPVWLACCLVPRTFLYRRWWRNLIALTGGFLLSLISLVCILDFYFFREFGERLNHKFIQYIKYDYIHRIILEQFPVIVVGLITVALFLVFGQVFLRWGSAPCDRQVKPWQVGICTVVCGMLIALGIRGTVGPKPINTGPAYFSDSLPVAQLALNGGFTLREAAISLTDKTVDLGHYFTLMPNEEALRITRNIFKLSPDRFFGDPDNPLRRVTYNGQEEKQYNVVLVILESLSWPYIGAMGGSPDLTPNLSAIANQGWLFDRCFAVGKRTTRGFSGIVSGFPDLPGDSVTTRSQSEDGFLTIATILKNRGFDTLFIYAGQPYYDHRLSFLGSNGFSRFVFEDEFVTHNFKTHLGWSDEDLFNTAHHVLETADRNRPFFATLLTLSFHRPYSIPPNRIEPTKSRAQHAPQIDAVRYVDWAVGKFMEKARKAEYFENTIFVFTADHMGGFKEHPTTVASFRVPFIIFAPAILSEGGRRFSNVCSQTDIPPTIISLLGGEYEHSFFGSSVIDRHKDDGIALMQSSDLQLHVIDGKENVVSVSPHGGGLKLFKFQAPDQLITRSLLEDKNSLLAESLRDRAIAILQTADLLYRRGSYRLREAVGQNRNHGGGLAYTEDDYETLVSEGSGN